jgi:outer membrane lipoprotein SlyB
MMETLIPSLPQEEFMENQLKKTSSLHPMLWVAAIAVTVLSLVGIAAMTGILPNSKSPATTEQPETVSSAPEVTAPVPVAEPAPAPVAQAPSKATPKPKPPVKQASTYTSAPKSSSESKTDSYRSQPAPPPCPNCAVVADIRPVAVDGEGSGLGAVAGGVLGAVVGNQIGKGSGRDVARIAGIAGGAYAGHQVEKSQRAYTAYDISVRYEDGSTQVLRENAQPVWQVGDKVRVESGKLVPR